MAMEQLPGIYGKAYYPPLLLDDELILGIFLQDKKTGIQRFKEYNEIENADKFLDDDTKLRLTDEDAREEIKKVIGEYEIATIKGLPKSQRDVIVGRIKEIEGLTQRQVSRILGIPVSLVNRAK